MTDTAELIARLRQTARDFASNGIASEAADALTSLVRERDEARMYSTGTWASQREADYYIIAAGAAEARATAAEADAARMREALGHYANPDNWSDGRWPQDDSDDENSLVPRCIPIMWQHEEGGDVPVADCGETARNALGGKDE